MGRILTKSVPFRKLSLIRKMWGHCSVNNSFPSGESFVFCIMGPGKGKTPQHFPQTFPFCSMEKKALPAMIWWPWPHREVSTQMHSHVLNSIGCDHLTSSYLGRHASWTSWEPFCVHSLQDLYGNSSMVDGENGLAKPPFPEASEARFRNCTSNASWPLQSHLCHNRFWENCSTGMFNSESMNKWRWHTWSAILAGVCKPSYSSHPRPLSWGWRESRAEAPC